MSKNKNKIPVIVFTNRGHTQRDHIESVSGHAQIPQIVCNKLYSADYDVTFITPRSAKDDDILAILDHRIKVRLVYNATPRFRSGGLNHLKLLFLIAQLYRIFRQNKGSIIHFFGMKRVGLLLGLLSLIGGPSYSVFTAVHYYKPSENNFLRMIECYLLRQIDCILPTSQYIAEIFERIGVQITGVLRPGLHKDFKESVDWLNKHEHVSRKSVLYWRDATYGNGVDIAIHVYRRLAPKYREIDFVFAIRHMEYFSLQIEALSIKYPNVHVHFFPYKNGIRLEKLLRSAICVLLPMRSLSIHPQFAILETMQAGVPLVTTNIESNNEVIKSGINGILFGPGDIAAACKAVETFIHDPMLRVSISTEAIKAVEISHCYNIFTKSLMRIYDDLLNFNK